MYNKKRKNNIIIGGLLAVVLIMGIGYAAFASKLNINGTGSVSSNFDVKITGITSKDIVGTAGNKTDPTYTDTTATFNTTLQSPGDSITYDITVSNNGSLDAVLNNITTTNGNNSAITFETSGLSQGDSLLKQTTKTLTVKVSYNSSVTKQPDSTTSTITVSLDFVQKELDSSDITTGPTMGGQSVEVVTTGDGLYADSTESGRYYYSGSSANNNTVFNGEPYKILGFEKDGRIKIIKMVSIGSKYWNTAGANVWANSSLKGYLEETWLPTQESGEDYQYIFNNNEWYVGAVSSSSDIAANYTAEKKTVVNSAVGLISTSEFLKSKYTGSTFLNVSSNWWTISPYASSSSDAWFVYSSGLGKSYVYRGSYAVFPVLYLKSSVSLTGSGTSTDPYCIKGSTCPKDLNFSQRTS